MKTLAGAGENEASPLEHPGDARLGTLFAFLGRTQLDPALVPTDRTVASHGVEVAVTLTWAITAVDARSAWARISCRYVAAQRTQAVISGAAWWGSRHSWPPPAVVSNLPDEIATLAELVTLLAGEGTELSDPAPVGAAQWARALPLLARSTTPAEPTETTEEMPDVCADTERRLLRVQRILEAWVANGPRTEPSEELWTFLERLGGLAGLLDNVGLLLERPRLIPQLRGASQALLNAGAVDGVPELRVAQALRVTAQGHGAYGAALADPTLNRIEFLDALHRLGAFLDLVDRVRPIERDC